MKAIVSTTDHDIYMFFLPIISFCWGKLGADLICFSPKSTNSEKESLAAKYCKYPISFYKFECGKHKEPTYTQCSRLYGACLDLPNDEVLVTTDIDMGVFRLPIPVSSGGGIYIWGADLIEEKQFPICYLSGTVKEWRDTFKLHNKTYQQALDELLGEVETLDMRGNYWSKDQNEAFLKISNAPHNKVNRTNGRNKFALHRVDRTDDYWRHSLNLELLDAHFWRPGYDQTNFEKILEVLQFVYPNENFDWLKEYRERYIQLL